MKNYCTQAVKMMILNQMAGLVPRKALGYIYALQIILQTDMCPNTEADSLTQLRKYAPELVEEYEEIGV